MLTTALITVYSLKSTLSSVTDDGYIAPFTTIETSFSERFNSFYFAATEACGGKSFLSPGILNNIKSI